jgi:tetratricopeptide (TPR) repeat protein
MFRWAGLVLPALLLWGCHACNDHELGEFTVGLAKLNYDAGKFDQAKTLYIKAIEHCPDSYEALVGLGNACREWGTELFRGAALLYEQKKADQAQKVFKEANDNHVEAERFLRTAMEREPDDLLPRYGMAQLFYYRATSPVAAPWPVDDRQNRQRERDEAIRRFREVIRQTPDAYQARRYLGLALFAAGDMDEARTQLKSYLLWRQERYIERVEAAAETDEEKRRKDIALREFEKDINDLREIYLVYLGELERERDGLKIKSLRTAEDERRLSRLASEILVVQGLIQDFQLSGWGPVQQDIRRTCVAYFETFNRGALQEVLSRLEPRTAEKESVRSALTDLIDRGTRYRNIRYVSIAVTEKGGDASVGVVCDVSSRSGNRANVELVVRCRVFAGKWFVSELPG